MIHSYALLCLMFLRIKDDVNINNNDKDDQEVFQGRQARLGRWARQHLRKKVRPTTSNCILRDLIKHLCRFVVFSLNRHCLQHHSPGWGDCPKKKLRPSLQRLEGLFTFDDIHFWVPVDNDNRWWCQQNANSKPYHFPIDNDFLTKLANPDRIQAKSKSQ